MVLLLTESKVIDTTTIYIYIYIYSQINWHELNRIDYDNIDVVKYKTIIQALCFS